MNDQNEHIDLEEKFQISANVEFNFSKDQNFEGLNSIEFTVKKAEHIKIPIENVEIRKRTNKSGLF